MPQFLVEPTACFPAERRAVLQGAEAHHLLRVLRARLGDKVDIFDGRGHRWRGRLSALSSAQAVLEDLAPLPANEPSLELWLLQSLPKGDRWSWLLAKGTELGVTRFLPVRSERTVAGGEREADTGKAARWASVAAAAAKQCERGTLPEVLPLATLGDCLRTLGRTAPGELRLCLTERQPGDALPRDSRPSRVILAVGPEGGWSPREWAPFRDAGFRQTGLGPRILRAETAALVSLTLALSLWGDLVAPPDPELALRSTQGGGS